MVLQMMVKVGLETHIELDVPRKLFCKCLRSQNCDVCMGVPGSIPVFTNKEALAKARLLALFFKSKVTEKLIYDRKHYYYVDSPKGYQLSQETKPFAKEGSLLLLRSNFRVYFEKIILEEDPASYDQGVVDYSRSGRAIIELVTKPCFQGSVESVKPLLKQYLQTLRRLCLDLKLSKSTMVLKSDVNVSLKGRTGQLEIKNVSSMYDILNSLDEAEKILDTNAIVGTQTYHCTSKGLVYSRPKTDYFFYRQPNLRPIRLMKVDSLSLPKLLYLYTKKLKEANTSSSFEKVYAYSKQLFLKKIDPIDSFLDLKQGSFKLKAKLENESECRSKIQAFLKENLLKKEDYLQKSRSYLDWLKLLKEILKKEKISFNSKYIEEVLNIFYNK